MAYLRNRIRSPEWLTRRDASKEEMRHSWGVQNNFNLMIRAAMAVKAVSCSTWYTNWSTQTHVYTHTLQHYFEGTQWLTHWSTQTHVHMHTAASFWRYPVANTLKYTNTCSHKHTEVHKHMFTQTLQHHSEGTQWLTHWSTQTHIYMLTHWSTQTHANTLKYTNTHSHAHCSIILKVLSG